MDSLIFYLQIVFYFQLFLSANVRHSPPFVVINLAETSVIELCCENENS